MKKKIYPKEVLKKIPKGYYCHGELVDSKTSLGVISLSMCPFWFKIKERKEQENGYCVLLGKGDYEINREPHTVLWYGCKNGKIEKKWRVKHDSKHPDNSSLLWDQCKGCNLNREEK
jgi:hypothetical protein